MAPDIVFSYLPDEGRGRSVLDPMTGSGTTVTAARSRGFLAVGSDTDPLAITIARANSSDLDRGLLELTAARILKDARKRSKLLKVENSYPKSADEETRNFIDYWFDSRSRVELTALSRAIEQSPPTVAEFIRCAFSRMIITKKNGVSLGEDVSHSRPHKTRNHPPIYPLDLFPRCVRAVANASNFHVGSCLPQATIQASDCRALPYEDGTFDYIITSPPYLNAIDYLRGHKMSLVWLGHTISQVRTLRSSNVGTEVGRKDDRLDDVVENMVTSESRPGTVLRNRLRAYTSDLNKAFIEMRRVSRDGGRMVLVVGDCTIKGCDVRNSIAVEQLAERHGFHLMHRVPRPLLERRRYLAPPSAKSGARLQKRMWEEIVFLYGTV
jgi:tRNA G10  N-methylase Trm11